MAKRVRKPPPQAISRRPPMTAAVAERVAAALERLAPAAPAAPDFAAADAFAWHPDGRRLAPVVRVNRADTSLLNGIDRGRDLPVQDSQRFARGLPAPHTHPTGPRR